MMVEVSYQKQLSLHLVIQNSCTILYGNTVEPPTTDSLYYGNLHNADKRPRSQIIPYSLLYIADLPYHYEALYSLHHHF